MTRYSARSGTVILVKINSIRRYPQLVAACAVILASSLCAQTPAPNDPFVRDGKAAPLAQGEQAEQLANVYGLVEYFEVARDAWLAYTAEHPLSNDATELRAAVQGWIAGGKAKAIEITCIPTMSGNRTAVESTIEWRYATEFANAIPTAVPTSVETRNTNFTFEWEPTVGPDPRVIYSQMAPQIVTYMGDSPKWSAGKIPPGSATQPTFSTMKTSVAVQTERDQPCLLQVSTPFDEQGKPRENVQILSFLPIDWLL